MANKYIGSKKFYKTVLAIALPIMLQNGITNFVSLLDNVMIGRVGTLQMSGVAIANQLIFVFNLCIFGALSGAGIFTAQFHGKGDTDSVKSTFRFKLVICFILAAIGITVLSVFGRELITLYLKGDGTAEAAALTLDFGMSYMKIMMFTFIPYIITQTYSGTLRETGETVLPMVAGVVAVLVNLTFNYILIYGHFGAPALGVAGAAYATVLSRFVELAIVIIGTHKSKKAFAFASGLYASFSIPLPLIKSISIKGAPLMLNETLWSLGIATLNQCYSVRSQDVVAATNITNTLWNVLSVIFMSLGSTVGIIVGHKLGAGDAEGAKDSARKMMVFSVAISTVIACIYAGVSGIFPYAYNATDSVRALATDFIIAGAFFMPFNAFSHASYFTLRAGGKTLITFAFDSLFVWAISVPLAFVLTKFTSLPILPIYTIIQALDILKCTIGLILVKKGIWINNITTGKKAEEK